MTHNITVLQRHGTYWHTPSQRLFHVTQRGGLYEARHAVSWYVGTGATVEAAMTDAAAHWTEVAPKAEDLWPEFERIAA